jgi:hypothetical protein
MVDWFGTTKGQATPAGHKSGGWKRSLSILSRLVIAVSSLLMLLLPTTGLALADSPQKLPDVIPLPNGFRPEGLAVGKGSTFYSGSMATGAIFQGNLVTGEGDILVPPQEGRAAIGIAYDRRTNYIYVAGGPTGAAYVYDAATGGNVATFQFRTGETFVNDVLITDHAAYFTDSSEPDLYRVPLSSDGSLPDPSKFEVIPLGGDFNFMPGQFNANGIEGPRDGRWLIIVHTALGVLYRVDPQTGKAQQVDLGKDSVPNGDGILLEDGTLYVVQNFLNQISVIKYDPQSNTGKLKRVITDPNFRIPTSIDEFRDTPYVVNARFDTPPTPDTEYEVVRVPGHFGEGHD